ncbi:sugar 3,4-ketoisomerase [Emticicia sp. SJ17W-69]|uniref:sugar 3,4-ketoisomerase n=1 Tax=Emticicia sp. SJ17W-69 TaxID=3421657 RepID=UPI003EBA1913
MAKLLHLQTFSSEKGSLTVFEKILPEGVKRIFYIYDAKNQIRGGHRHKLALVALACVSGKCKVFVDNGSETQIFELSTPDTCLLLDPSDWHQMYDFSDDAVLLVLSDRYYEKEDYIYEKYPERVLK